MKLNYRQTFLLGFGFLGVSVIWTLYNAYVPIFLQAGNPEFKTAAKPILCRPIGRSPGCWRWAA